MVSAFGEQSIQSGSDVLPGVLAVPVPRPPSPFLDGAVELKSKLRKRSASGAGPQTGVGDNPAVQRSALSQVRDAYFRGVYFVDGYKRWAWRAARKAIRAGREHPVSVILASGPPHSALVAGAYAARVLRVPFVADLRDPWADDVDGILRRKGGERRLIDRIERAVLGSATSITSTGATVAELLASRNRALRNKLHVIRNGYDGPVTKGVAATGGRLSILFAGELYAGRDPFPFLRALEWLLGQPGVDGSRVQVTFMGKVDSHDGKRLSEVLRGTLGAAVVRLLPPQPPAAVAIAVEESTVLLNLAQGQRLSVPAKTFEHLASGRENLLVCEDDCETARLVAGIEGVNQVDPRDFARLTATLLALYNRHVLLGELTSPNSGEIGRFSREASNDAFLQLLRSVCSDGPPSGSGKITA